jgi:hypothetical protein
MADFSPRLVILSITAQQVVQDCVVLLTPPCERKLSIACETARQSMQTEQRRYGSNKEGTTDSTRISECYC